MTDEPIRENGVSIKTQPATRDRLRELKRGGETYDGVLQRLLEEHEDLEASEYRVPLIDPGSGDGWDVEVEASSATDAIQKATEEADGQPHVASTFLRDHGMLPGEDAPEGPR